MVIYVINVHSLPIAIYSRHLPWVQLWISRPDNYLEYLSKKIITVLWWCINWFLVFFIWQDDGPEIPEYPLMNIQMKGYDFAVLEKYSKYVHNFVTNIGQESTA